MPLDTGSQLLVAHQHGICAALSFFTVIYQRQHLLRLFIHLPYWHCFIHHLYLHYFSSCPFLTLNSCTRSLQIVSGQHCSLAIFEFCPLAWGLMHVGYKLFTQGMKSVSPWMAYHPACTAKCGTWQIHHIQNQPLVPQPAATILEAPSVVTTGWK